MWKKLMLSAIAMAVLSCGGDNGASGSSGAVDCSESPALSKSCLEGTWELSSATWPNVQNSVPASAGEPLDLSNGANAVYRLQFIIRAKANYKDLSVADSVIFTKTSEDGSEVSYGTFMISPDKQSLSIRFTTGDRDGGQYTSKATVDRTTLKFEPSRNPPLANASVYPIAMYFWRVNP